MEVLNQRIGREEMQIKQVLRQQNGSETFHPFRTQTDNRRSTDQQTTGGLADRRAHGYVSLPISIELCIEVRELKKKDASLNPVFNIFASSNRQIVFVIQKATSKNPRLSSFCFQNYLAILDVTEELKDYYQKRRIVDYQQQTKKMQSLRCWRPA